MTVAANTETLPRNLRARVATYPEVIYSETAFRGDMESEHIRLSFNTPLQCKYLPNKTRCHEYLAIDFMASELESYKKYYRGSYSSHQDRYDKKLEQSLPTKKPAAYYFFNFGLPVSFASKSLQFLAGFILLTSPITVLGTLVLVSIRDKDQSSFVQRFIEGGGALLPYVALILATYLFLKWLNGTDVLIRLNNKPSIRLVLRRDTGMVQFKKKGRFVDVPFSEVMGMTRHHTDDSGIRRITLHLNHKHSKLNRNLDSGLQALGSALHENERWWYHLRWEFIQHYMDVTRPLPDIPELEPYRHLDPTTREWDKKHNRPKDYWLNMNQETYKAMVDVACEKAKTYPYDDAYLAEKIGWIPAGDGKAWYQLG